MKRLCVGKNGDFYAADWMRLDGRYHDIEVHVEPHRTRHWVDGTPRWKWMMKHPFLAVRLLAWTRGFMARARALMATNSVQP